MPPKKTPADAAPAETPSPEGTQETQLVARHEPVVKDKKGKYAPPVEPGKTQTVKERMDSILTSQGMKSFAKTNTNTKIAAASSFSAISPRIPTGLVALDIMMRGGIPAGVMHHWFGAKACGKTTLALLLIAAAQKLCSNCYRPFATEGGCCDKPRRFVAAILNVEGVIDWVWAVALGVDRDALLYVKPETAEQSLDCWDGLMASGEVDLVVIDSIAAMIPESELGKSAAEFDVGTQARIMHRLVRKAYSYLNQMDNRDGRRPTVVLLNQLRMKVGVMFGNPETTAAGMGPGYGSAVEIRFSPAKHQKDNADPTGDPLYVTIYPKVEKTKLFPGKGAECEFTLMQKDTADQKLGEVMDAAQLVDLATRSGILEGSAPNVLCLGRNFRGKSAVEMELMKDRAFASQVREAVLQVMVKR